MRIWRALAVPFDMASLIFVLISSVLLAMLVGNGLVAFFPIMILVLWLFKYGFGVLEHVAHGYEGAPVVSTELLGPFEIRPWIQAGVCAGGYLLVHFLDEPASSAIAIIACLILPAWVGLLGIADRFYQAFNPVMLWHMLRAMSFYYFIVLALIGLACLIFVSVHSLPLWLSLRFVLMEYCLLASYSVIGEAIFSRRLELGFAARSSPERKHDQASRERDKERQHAIDEIYEAVNARQYVRATGRLEAWLATVEPAHIGGDAQEITAAAVLWRNEPGLNSVLQSLLAWLIAKDRSADAVEVARAAVTRVPGFSPSTEPAALAVAEAAQSLGQPRLGVQVLENFAQRYPQVPLSPRAHALLAERHPK
jgi:hypothetical protein